MVVLGFLTTCFGTSFLKASTFSAVSLAVRAVGLGGYAGLPLSRRRGRSQRRGHAEADGPTLSSAEVSGSRLRCVHGLCVP